ncbi:hypothetical protein FO519_009850 [Halicephalobus sp. NKZ332]|nr:hypothetical protein FO519_009850 [Halicephalobus sp. NKZ332]
MNFLCSILLVSLLCFAFADVSNPPTYNAEQCFYCNRVIYYTDGMEVSWGHVPGWDPNYLPVLESLVCDLYDGNPTCINVTDTIGTLVWADTLGGSIWEICSFIPPEFSELIHFFCEMCDLLKKCGQITSDKVCPMFGCPATKFAKDIHPPSRLVPKKLNIVQT